MIIVFLYVKINKLSRTNDGMGKMGKRIELERNKESVKLQEGRKKGRKEGKKEERQPTVASFTLLTRLFRFF